jgi:hypothetical protein
MSIGCGQTNKECHIANATTYAIAFAEESPQAYLDSK